MNTAQKSVPLVRNCARRWLSSAVDKEVVGIARPKSKKIKEIQKMFQVEDGVPVYLKAGFKDRALYQFTLFGNLFITGWSLKVFWDLINK